MQHSEYELAPWLEKQPFKSIVGLLTSAWEMSAHPGRILALLYVVLLLLPLIAVALYSSSSHGGPPLSMWSALIIYPILLFECALFISPPVFFLVRTLVQLIKGEEILDLRGLIFRYVVFIVCFGMIYFIFVLGEGLWSDGRPENLPFHGIPSVWMTPSALTRIPGMPGDGQFEPNIVLSWNLRSIPLGRRELDANKVGDTIIDCLHVSAVTAMTLGYADIYPQRRYTRVLADCEALMGVLFIAILIGKSVNLSLQNRDAP